VEGKEHLDLVTPLLDVADVVEDHGVEGVERDELAFEAQVALGGEQPLDESEGRREEDAVATTDELVPGPWVRVGDVKGVGEREDPHPWPWPFPPPPRSREDPCHLQPVVARLRNPELLADLSGLEPLRLFPVRDGDNHRVRAREEESQDGKPQKGSGSGEDYCG
jgi:hypothetical protein